jgi:DNA-directed RNA polymerase specialized sigma24 family protein
MLKLLDKYSVAAVLYKDLKANKNEAFTYLIRKIKGSIVGICRDNQILDQADDVLQQTLTTLLKKLDDGSYVLQNNASPVTYAVSVAKFLVMNHKKGIKANVELTNVEHTLWTHNDWDGVHETVNFYLSLLGEDCQQIIRLRKLEDFRYKEIIEQKLMPKFTNEGSLRNKFEACWNRLMEQLQVLGEKQ